MAIVINGSGTVTGLAVGGLPDDSVDEGSLANSINTSIGAKLPLAGGSITGNVNFGDNVKAQFGDANDLNIYHNGTHSIIQDSGSGDLKIWSSKVEIQSPDAGENIAIFNDDGDVQLYHNNALKLATVSNGIKVTDRVTGSADLVLATVDSNEKIHMDSDGYIKLETNGSESMRIRSNGFVGIGDTNPRSNLKIKRATPATTAGEFGHSLLNLHVHTANNEYSQITFGYGTAGQYGAAYIGYKNTNTGNEGMGSLVFGTRNTTTNTTQPEERMVILPSGNVGIADSNPSAKLTIASAGTTTNGLEVVANLVTTGSVAHFYSNASNTSTRAIVRIHQDHPNASGTDALKVVQDAAGNGIYLNQIGNKYGFYTKHEASTYAAQKIVADSLTTKQIAHFYSDSSSSTVRNLVEIQNDHSNANGATMLNINNDATGPLADISGTGGAIHNGMITRVFSFVTNLNATLNFDIPMANTVNVFEIKALIGYYPGASYYASTHGFYAYRSDTGIVRVENFNDHSSSNSGSWTVSNPNTTTLRVTKVAGSASAFARGFVEVKYRNA